jgi:ankyrin repeat protein
MNGRHHIVRALLRAGAQVDAGDNAALYWACRHGHRGVAEVLVGAGADIHARHDVMLDVAAAFGHADVLKFLLQKGAKLPEDGGLALKWAQKTGQQHCADIITEHLEKMKGPQQGPSFSMLPPRPPAPPKP